MSSGDKWAIVVGLTGWAMALGGFIKLYFFGGTR